MKYLEFAYAKQEKIWGTEDWIISAHKNGPAKIKGENYTLSEFYSENRKLFGKNLPEEFPLLVKIIDTNDDLSIQVHPGDKYAKEYENSLGKTECWYILDEKDSDIIAGQSKTSREEVKAKIESNDILDVLSIQKIKKGDFFFIPAGCVHAIRKNTKLLEIQQSSDVTYRLYDYDRRDDAGNLRDLHITQSLDVIDYDYHNDNQIVETVDENGQDCTQLCTSEYFYVDLYKEAKNLVVKTKEQFKLVVAVDGPMEVDGKVINENEGIIILCEQEVEIKSAAKVVISGISRN